jgi:hypothetical protein
MEFSRQVILVVSFGMFLSRSLISFRADALKRAAQHEVRQQVVIAETINHFQETVGAKMGASNNIATDEGMIRSLVENWARAVRAKGFNGIIANHSAVMIVDFARPSIWLKTDLRTVQKPGMTHALQPNGRQVSHAELLVLVWEFLLRRNNAEEL